MLDPGGQVLKIWPLTGSWILVVAPPCLCPGDVRCRRDVGFLFRRPLPVFFPLATFTTSVFPAVARERSRLLFLLLALVGATAMGCSNSARRLNERETIQYKLHLARERRSEISPGKVDKLMYHPARTPREIDRAFDDLAREHAQEVAADNAEHARAMEEERKARAEEEAAQAAAKEQNQGVKDVSGGETRKPTPPAEVNEPVDP